VQTILMLPVVNAAPITLKTSVPMPANYEWNFDKIVLIYVSEKKKLTFFQWWKNGSKKRVDIRSGTLQERRDMGSAASQCMARTASFNLPPDYRYRCSFLFASSVLVLRFANTVTYFDVCIQKTAHSALSPEQISSSSNL
jgi:hypothetical protein